MPSPENVDRVQARYDQVKLIADLFLPYLSPEYAARIRRGELIIEQALIAARAAATIIGQSVALAQAEAALADVDAAVAPR